MKTKPQIRKEIKQIRERAERSRSQADRVGYRRRIANLLIELESAPNF